MERLRFAVIGCGGRGSGVAEMIAAVTNAQLVAVCDVVEQNARAVGERLGVPFFTKTEAMYEAVDVDAVFIATPVEHHFALAKEAVLKGKHVILEKIMTTTAQEAYELAELARQKKICGALSYQLRFYDVYRKWWAVGQSLEPTLIISSRHPGIMPPNYLRPDPWAGVVDFLSHDIDLVYWVAGREPSLVTAIGYRSTVVVQDTWDTMTILLDFGSMTGLVYSAMAGGGLPSTHAVIGRKGNVRIESDSLSVHRFVRTNADRYERQWERLDTEPVKEDTTGLLVQHFSDWVQGIVKDPFPLSTFEDGYKVMLIHDGIAESLKARQTISLEHIHQRIALSQGG
ncbi:MAG: Gfo/Idh/MocA family oxidoreductase [Armatimonadetes bacterium]|nr:Gfo/Idh/MocA family oxidoreductase [Armatimonadota bacterium]MDW8122155.1 Gfo/Idh/MocA family oxidoreductase [Armatimonadota bacterium]